MKNVWMVSAVLLLGGSILAASACEPPCDESAGCSGGGVVQGDPSSFTLGPQETETIDISAPESCIRENGSRILLTSYGSKAVGFGRSVQDGEVNGSDWWYGQVGLELADRGISAPNLGFGTSCLEDEARFYVAIFDWGDANEAARAIGRQMIDNDLNVQVELQVVDQVQICAQLGCY